MKSLGQINQRLSHTRCSDLWLGRCSLTALLMAAFSFNPQLSLAAPDSAEVDRSTWTATSSVGSDARLAFDHDIATRWTTQTPQTMGQTFTLDLGVLQNLDRLVMVTTYNQLNKDDYPRGYVLFLSDDGENWGNPVATGLGSPDGTTVIDFQRQPTRFVRILQVGDASYNYWSIHDLKAYGEVGPLASGEWSVSASNNGGSAINAIDNSIDSRWTTQQPQQAGQTFTINMKESKMVERIVMVTNNGSHFNLDFPRGYEIHLSDDGVTWGDAVASGAGSHLGTTDIAFTRQAAKFIRVTQTGGDAFYWWSIHNLSVFGSDNLNPGNESPAASFIVPTPPDGSTLDVNTDVGVAIDADDSDGFIESVRLYINNQLLEVKSLPPFRWSSEQDVLVSDLPEGRHDLRAEVTDNQGGVTTLSSSFVISGSELQAGIRHPDIVSMLNIRLSDIPYGPDAEWWGDSYSVGDQCFCDTTFDHDIDLLEVDTPLGTMNVRDACNLIGPGPGSEGRPKYNDIQCGNGPVNGTDDEAFCPGQINAPGTTEQQRLACNNVGPKWNFDAIETPVAGAPAVHPDIVKVLDRPLEDILYAPDQLWWADSYSVGDQCFCDTTFDHEIGTVQVETSIGIMTVEQACQRVGPGPGSEGRPKYNDVQCGNGPVNGTIDEDFCPGQTNSEGTDEERRLGCNNIGPTWKFDR